MALLKKLFNNKKEIDEVAAIMTGELKSISDAPDPAFAQKLMGDGYVIFPNSGEVVAPFDGKITMVYPTKHVIALTSNSGLEVLIHIGLDTVKLNGEGFELLAQVDDDVKKGQQILKVDLEFIKSKNLLTATPVVITNLNERTIEIDRLGDVIAGEVVLKIEK
jgi:glucose-specific phosphotransferase system IIA component